MKRSRLIRKHAPELLEVSKEAFRHLVRQDPHPTASEEEERQKLLQRLRETIDTVEPPSFDAEEHSITLMMTPKSWEVLRQILEQRASSGNETDENLLNSVQNGVKITKQRVYVSLDINPALLHQLLFILRHQAPVSQRSAFRRMAEQIEEEGLSKNPMEILGEQGI